MNVNANWNCFLYDSRLKLQVPLYILNFESLRMISLNPFAIANSNVWTMHGLCAHVREAGYGVTKSD